MAENIVHLVLARIPGAPEGVKGISLFIVPKYLVDESGAIGKRNDVCCASIEHKLGIKASPTAVLVYGDDKGEVGAGAIGHLIGEENRGLEYMFIMMNAARFAVGMQGIAIAEGAYQKAVRFARERVQSRAVEGSSGPVADHRPSRCAAHADDDARLHRRRAGAGLCRGRRLPMPSMLRRTRLSSRRTRPSTNSWCRSSRASPPR